MPLRVRCSLTAAVLLATPLRLSTASAAAAAVVCTTCSRPPCEELEYCPSSDQQTSAAAAAAAGSAASEHAANNRERRSELRLRPSVAVRGGGAGPAALTSAKSAGRIGRISTNLGAGTGPGKGRRHMRMAQISLAEQWDRITASTSRDYDDELERKLLGIDELISSQLHAADENASEIAGQTVPTINPLSQNKWILLASGALLATSALALAVYLYGGLAAASSTTVVAAAAGSSLSDPSALTQAASTAASTTAVTASIERFNWFLRGGGAGLSRGLSRGLSSLKPFSLNSNSVRQVSTYVTQRVLPSAFATLKKMAIMEIWRRIWIVVFHQVTHGMKALTRGASRRFGKAYQRYTPKWIRLGAKSVFKSSVQRAVHGAVGVWIGHAVGGARDVVSDVLTTSVFSSREAVEVAASEVAEAAAEAVPDMVAESVAEGVLDSAADAADAAVEEACGGLAEALSSSATAAVSTQ